MVLLTRTINQVVMADLTEKTALFEKEKNKAIVLEGVCAQIFLLMPLSVLLVFLAVPFIEIILLHGMFDQRMAAQTASIFKYYSLGLVGFGLYGLTTRIYAARIAEKTSKIFDVWMLAFNIILAIILSKTYLGVSGIALASSATFLLFSLLRILQIKSKINRGGMVLYFRELLVPFLKSVFAAVFMIIVLIESNNVLKRLAFESLLLKNVFLVISLVFIGSATYLLMSLLLKNSQMLFFKKKRVNNAGSVPISMLPAALFYEKVLSNPDFYKEEYAYKVNIYAASSHWAVQNIGVKLIGLFGRADKADLLVALAKNHRNCGFIRRNAINSLGRLNVWNPQISDLMKNTLQDSYYEIRAESIRLLTKSCPINDLEQFKYSQNKRIHGRSLEEKIAWIQLLAKKGNQEDLQTIKPFLLAGNSLLREEVLNLIYSFYQRQLLDAAQVQSFLNQILITSNHMLPVFKLKSILARIGKELQ
jgi:hypothetical protein